MTEPKIVQSALVERLRAFRFSNEWGDPVHDTRLDAMADEVAALQDEVERLTSELNALRSAVDGVTEAADIIASRAETAETRVRELEAGLREIDNLILGPSSWRIDEAQRIARSLGGQS